MSEVPLPPSAQPFVATTTRNIERANHLLSLRAHPGFQEILALLAEMVKEAVDTCTNYPGWDAQQIVVLKVRQQAATELRDMLVAKINEAVQVGLSEASMLEAEKKLPPKTAQEIIEQGDHVRRIVLEKFQELDTANETRSPGSF